MSKQAKSVIACCALWLCGGCGSMPASAEGLTDGGAMDTTSDADTDANEHAPDATIDDGGAGGSWSTDSGASDAAEDAGEPVDAGDADAGTDPAPPAAWQVEMTFTTANIGRDYATRADVAAVFDRVGDQIGPKSGPKFIGWQEIGEGDPCGNDCEIEELENRFKPEWSWDTRRPRGDRPDGGKELVKVPVTAKGANDSVQARAVYASAGWAGVSPTRFVTVVRYASRNVSVVNTHFIAGAWSCKSNVEQRKDYWRQAWKVLKAEVAKERDLGWNVIVTGDLNRPRDSNGCNPAWDPLSLHPEAKLIGGSGIDYEFAVPAADWRFVYSRKADGSVKRGTVTLGIDGHEAHWVSGSFAPQ